VEVRETMIKLKDILKLNPFVTLLDLDVRDPDLRLLKHVVIGKDYRVSSSQMYDEVKGKFEYIEVDINKHGRVGRSGFSEMAYDIDWKAIPKQYLDMEVDMINHITDRYGTNKGMVLRATVIPIQMGII
jgi:hypothetical protein